MKLYVFHVQQFRARMIRERHAVARAFPGVGGNLESATKSASGKHNGLRLENAETSALAVVTKCADDTAGILKQGNNRVFHVNRDALMNAVNLQSADHFEAGAVANVREPRVFMAAKLRCKIFPSFVRSKTAPQASSSRTRAGASFACSSA